MVGAVMVGRMGWLGTHREEEVASGRNVVGQSEGMTVDRGHLKGGVSQHTHDRPRRGGSAVSGRQQAVSQTGAESCSWREPGKKVWIILQPMSATDL